MAIKDDILEARAAAQLSVLRAIKTMADQADEQGEWTARATAHYAEAYAWLYAPSQPHGGGSAPPRAS